MTNPDPGYRTTTRLSQLPIFTTVWLADTEHFRDTCGFTYRTNEVELLRNAAAEGWYTKATEITVFDEADDHAALEVVFAICNSYVATMSVADALEYVNFGKDTNVPQPDDDELHCHPLYRGDVVRYRNGGNRSLSCGDVVTIGLKRYGVASMGFVQF